MPAAPASAPEPSVEIVVLGELARGGMARVELARVLPAGEIVALKRLLPMLAMDRDFVQMFMDEAWMGAALDHENIVRILACGEDEDGMFLAMELVYGAPLGAIADAAREHGEPFPAELVALVAHGVARGLEAAHGLRDCDGVPFGLVHRDVTPSNVLVGFDGAVKITDFGVARAAGRASQTAEGMLKGKLSFLAPEYASARQLDGRSDLYALGVTLFWLVTGKRPFEGPSDAELLRRITDEPPPPLRELVPDFDAALGELIMRLLRKDPRERPPDAAAVCRELEAWLARRGTDPGALGARLGEFVTRHGEERRRRIDGLVAEGASPAAPDSLPPDVRTTTPEGSADARRTTPERSTEEGATALEDSADGLEELRSTAKLARATEGRSGAGIDPDAPTLPLDHGRESRRATLRRAVPSLELHQTQRQKTRVVAAPAVGGAAPRAHVALASARLPAASAIGATPRRPRGAARRISPRIGRSSVAAAVGIAALAVAVAGWLLWWAGQPDAPAPPAVPKELGATAERISEQERQLRTPPRSRETDASVSPMASATAPEDASTVAPADSSRPTASTGRPRPGATPTPKPRSTVTTARSCTPSDFDYPNCATKR